jgi:hypothetical protein
MAYLPVVQGRRTQIARQQPCQPPAVAFECEGLPGLTVRPIPYTIPAIRQHTDKNKSTNKKTFNYGEIPVIFENVSSRHSYGLL